MSDESRIARPPSAIEAVSERVQNYGSAPMATNVCPVRTIMDMVGSKWATLLIITLAGRAHRFGEIKRAVPDISQRMLTQTLRELQRDGLVTRTVHPTAPPTVEYALTPLCRSLLEPLMQLIGWMEANQGSIETARSQFDSAH